MSGRRLAVVVAVERHDDPVLRDFSLPAPDVAVLPEVLGDPDLGGFELDHLVDPEAREAYATVEAVLNGREPDDCVLVFFRGILLAGPIGGLYLAGSDTVVGRLADTAVDVAELAGLAQRSRAGQVVVMLDGRAGGPIDVGGQFEALAAEGRSRVVLAAAARAQTPTLAGLIAEGVHSGAADRDRDGMIGLDELFDHLRERDRTVRRWVFGSGQQPWLARAPRPRDDRLTQVAALVAAATGADLSRAAEARQALTAMADGSDRVAAAASAALRRTSIRLTEPVLDFGLVGPGTPQLTANVAVDGPPLVAVSSVAAAGEGLHARLEGKLLRVTWFPTVGRLDGSVTVEGPAGAVRLTVIGEVAADVEGTPSPWTAAGGTAAPQQRAPRADWPSGAATVAGASAVGAGAGSPDGGWGTPAPRPESRQQPDPPPGSGAPNLGVPAWTPTSGAPAPPAWTPTSGAPNPGMPAWTPTSGAPAPPASTPTSGAPTPPAWTPTSPANGGPAEPAQPTSGAPAEETTAWTPVAPPTAVPHPPAEAWPQAGPQSPVSGAPSGNGAAPPGSPWHTPDPSPPAPRNGYWEESGMPTSGGPWSTPAPGGVSSWEAAGAPTSGGPWGTPPPPGAGGWAAGAAASPGWAASDQGWAAAPPPGYGGPSAPPAATPAGYPEERSGNRRFVLLAGIFLVIAVLAGGAALGVRLASSNDDPQQPSGLGAPPPASATAQPENGNTAAPKAPSAPASVPNPAVVGRITGAGAEPEGVVVSPDNRTVYVADQGSRDLLFVDAASGKVQQRITMPNTPRFLTLSADGAKLYATMFATDRSGSSLAVVETASRKLLRSVSTGPRPFAAAIDANRRIWVPIHDGARVEVYETTTLRRVATITVPPNPHWVAFSPDRATAYTSNHESSQISVIDAATQKVRSNIKGVGRSPHSITVTPDGKTIVVTNFDADTMETYDTQTLRRGLQVRVGDNPQAVAVAADGKRAYVVNEGTDSVSVVDLQNGAVTATVKVGASPRVIAVSPNGRFAYVTDGRANSVTVLEVAPQ